MDQVSKKWSKTEEKGVWTKVEIGQTGEWVWVGIGK